MMPILLQRNLIPWLRTQVETVPYPLDRPPEYYAAVTADVVIQVPGQADRWRSIRIFVKEGQTYNSMRNELLDAIRAWRFSYPGVEFHFWVS